MLALRRVGMIELLRGEEDSGTLERLDVVRSRPCSSDCSGMYRLPLIREEEAVDVEGVAESSGSECPLE